MYIDDPILATGIFISWHVSAIVVGVLKGTKTKIPRRNFVIFLIAGGLLAMTRVLTYRYLGYRNGTHTAYSSLRPLYLFLMPDGSFAGTWLRVFRVYNPRVSDALICGSLIIGSFAWAVPLILWLVPRPRKSHTTISL
jgi:hypothetical protein